MYCSVSLFCELSLGALEKGTKAPGYLHRYYPESGGYLAKRQPGYHRTMLANSEFVALLRQSSTDLDTVADALNISEAQLDYVNNAPAGTGLLRFGSVVIPFDETVSKDSKLYQMYNTNPYELAEQAESADGGGGTGYPAED